jgi:hypothetical protein
MTDQWTKTRSSLTRWIVPHESFDWYIRGIGITAVATGLVLGLGSWIYHQRLFHAIGLAEVVDPAAIEQFTRLSLISTGIVSIISGLYITLVAGFLFHRVAGPVYHMQKHMRGVIDGNTTDELKLRSTDQLGDLCVTYNQLLYSLEAIEPKPMTEAPRKPAPVVTRG